jgi:chymotrypsin
MHESYSTVGHGNDIALVRLVNTIKSDPNVGIISLPKRSEVSTPLEGKMATIAGFGRYTDKSGPSQQLRFVQNQIVANSVCEKTYGKANIRATNLCLEGTGGRSSCQGDSGGGLHLELNGRKVVVGVVSFGAEAGCTLNYPAVYTRVASYLDWIQGKTGIRIE